MHCRDVMKHDLVSVAPEATAQDAARCMQSVGVGFLPICDPEGRVLGVVTDRDLTLRVCAEGLKSDSVTVRAVMSQNVIGCRTDDPVADVEATMERHHKSRLVVLDDEGRLAGVISATDLLQCEEPLRAARLLRTVSSPRFRYESPASSRPPRGDSE